MVEKRVGNVFYLDTRLLPRSGQQWKMKDGSDPLKSVFKVVGIESKTEIEPIVWFESTRENIFKQPLSVFLNLYERADD